MTADIVRFPGITKLDTDPDRALAAATGKLDGVIIIGFDKEGEYYFASSYADGGDTLWLVEQFKRFLLSIGHE